MNNETLSKALKIQKELLKSEFGYIENNGTYRDLFIDYLNPDVSNILNIICEEFDFNVFKVQDRIYLSPYAASFLSVSESDISRYFYISKEKECLDDSRIRLYLFYYTVLNFLSIIYSGFPIKKTQDYTTLNELISTIDNSTARALSVYDEKMELEVGFSILKSCYAWDKFTLDSDGNGEMNSKSGFAKKSIAYLKKEGLVKVMDDNEFRIYPERKLTDLIVNGGLDIARIQELKINIQNNIE